MADDFDAILTRIVSTIAQSDLSDTQKADCWAQLDLGLHKLVWPILVSHVPERDLKDAVDRPETLTVERYGELMRITLDDPETPKEIHEEVIGALGEVEELLTKQGIPPKV